MAKMTTAERKVRDAAFDELMASINPAFALRREIRAARTRANLSQRDLAGRMGIKQPTIARLESGRQSPNFKTLHKLAEATGSRLVIRLEAANALDTKG